MKKKTDIKYIDTLSFEKFNEKCYVCLKKGFGPCIKCNYKSCNFQIGNKKLKYEKLANRCRGNASSLRFLAPNQVLQLENGLFLEKEAFSMVFSQG